MTTTTNPMRTTFALAVAVAAPMLAATGTAGARPDTTTFTRLPDRGA